MQTLQSTKPQSKGGRWAGLIITILCLLFLLFDSIGKIAKEIHSVQGSAKLGWPVDHIQDLGFTLLFCTLLYSIPRVAFLGAILLTAYLGGAVSIMLRVGEPFFFPIVFAFLVWLGLYFRNAKFRSLVASGK
jgi:hypothetical protein